MPIRFELLRKSDVDAGPVDPDDVNKELCKALGMQVDKVHTHHDWYGSTGLRLAMGRSFDEIIAEYTGYIHEKEYPVYFKHAIEVARWLDDNFISKCEPSWLSE